MQVVNRSGTCCIIPTVHHSYDERIPHVCACLLQTRELWDICPMHCGIYDWFMCVSHRCHHVSGPMPET